jgi:hypothetical protein
MKRSFSLTALPGVVTSQGLLAQQEETPGVTEVAPGVTEIDGAKVRSTDVASARIAVAITQDNRFRSVENLFKVKGNKNPGPAGSITHIYKIKDPDTKDNMVVVLFVRDGLVLDYVVTPGAPS